MRYPSRAGAAGGHAIAANVHPGYCAHGAATAIAAHAQTEGRRGPALTTSLSTGYRSIEASEAAARNAQLNAQFRSPVVLRGGAL